MSGNHIRRLRDLESAKRAKEHVMPQQPDFSEFTMDELEILEEYFRRDQAGEDVAPKQLSIEIQEKLARAYGGNPAPF